MIAFKAPQKYVPSVQVLRAVAAWSVVMSHYCQVFFGFDMTHSMFSRTFGQVSRWYLPLGVDVFFVISGFIIFLSAQKTTSVKRFFLNRASRIIPPYWFFTFCLLILVTLFPEANKTEVYWTFESLMKSLFFIHHENPAPSLGEYPFLTVGWSLNYEVMFYLLCAAFLIIFRKWWALFLVLLFMSSNTIWIFDVANYFFHSYYIYEFCWGMILGFVYGRGWIPNSNLIGLAILCLSGYVFLLEATSSDILNALAVILLVLGGLCFKDKVFNNPVGKLMQHLGNISYSTYLAHAAISFSVCLTLYRGRGDSDYSNEPYILGTYILLTYACSYFGYRYIENNSFNRWVRNL